MLRLHTCNGAIAIVLAVGVRTVAAQGGGESCAPIVLSGTVLDCSATGSSRAQLRTSTFIAGSAAVGDMLAQAVGLEVATAPVGSSSGGFTFTFDSARREWNRTSATFGPAFSERALTLGKGKMSAGFNFIERRYDRLDGLELENLTPFRFEGGSLAVRTSTLALQLQTDTVAAFAHYGVLNNIDVGLLVPYVRVSLSGDSIITGQGGEQLQRVRLDATNSGIGDVAIIGKYRFWQSGEGGAATTDHAALAIGVTGRVPSGDHEDLLGLGAGRVLLSFIGSGAIGRVSPHLNVGYEFWSDAIRMTRDFQGDETLSVKDQVQYSAGIEFEQHARFTLIMDVLGRYQRGGGRVGSQPFVYGPNRANVAGAEALVAIPGGYHTLTLAPGVKWNFFRAALLTGSVLVTTTDGGLTDRVTPVVGLDWGF